MALYKRRDGFTVNEKARSNEDAVFSSAQAPPDVFEQASPSPADKEQGVFALDAADGGRELFLPHKSDGGENSVERTVDGGREAFQTRAADGEADGEPKRRARAESERASRPAPLRVSARRTRLQARRLDRKAKRGIALVAVICVALVFASSALYYTVGARHRARRPEAVADSVADAYNARDAEKLLELCVNAPKALRDPEVFADYLEDSLGDAVVTVSHIEAVSDGEYRCELAAGGTSVARLELARIQNSGPFGSGGFEAAALEQYSLSLCEIIAPAEARVYIDGELLSDDEIVKREEFAACFAEVSAPCPERAVYETGDLCLFGEMSAAFLGRECEAVRTDGGLEFVLIPEGERAGELMLFCEAAAKAYAELLFVKGSPEKDLLTVAYPDAPLLKRLDDADKSQAVDCDRTRFDELRLSGARQYSETEYSCECSFVAVLLDAGGGELAKRAFGCEVFAVHSDGAFAAVDIQIRPSI